MCFLTQNAADVWRHVESHSFNLKLNFRPCHVKPRHYQDVKSDWKIGSASHEQLMIMLENAKTNHCLLKALKYFTICLPGVFFFLDVKGQNES